ncbi:MAG: HlyD family efflux transporter periplasmic adaptor subunit [Sphingobacteriaceae bacterium]|nr:MAG: HlyD family efflux transporter periplasmic adaptor subunit [Sphingobacteriaceae bacterium]
MNKNEIFPAEFMSLTTEYHFHKYNPRTNIIYRIVLAFTLLAFLSMFFIKVNINVKSAGIIRSTVEHNEIKTLVSAQVGQVFLKENMHVKKGQVLVVLRAGAINQQDMAARSQQTDYENQHADLDVLANIVKTKNWSARPQLRSTLYSQQFALFNQQARDAKATLEVAGRNYNRYQYLYNKHMVSAAEYDKIQLEYRKAASDLQLVYDGQGSRWQAELNELNTKMRGLQSSAEGYKEEKDLYTLRAPVSGTIQNVKGIQPGSVVAANEILAEISPETGLIAEAYVLPKDIGLLRTDVKATFQVDAYNYNEWGLLNGKIISVSNDVYAENGSQPYFKVRCQLDEKSLKLKNGYEGKLKKGMTLQANFFVARRTLYQLLYDKVDDWLNPNRITNSAKEAANAG